jgi:hypothetical protein
MTPQVARLLGRGTGPVTDPLVAAAAVAVIAPASAGGAKVTYDDLLSFNRRERQYLASKFDAEFMDLHRFIMQSLTGRAPQADEDGNAPIVKVETVDGRRVAADDILIEMLLVIRRRTVPDTPDDFYDDLAFLDLVGLLDAPKVGS